MEVDQINGVGTLIVPGDHVDVILTRLRATARDHGIKTAPSPAVNRSRRRAGGDHQDGHPEPQDPGHAAAAGRGAGSPAVRGTPRPLGDSCSRACQSCRSPAAPHDRRSSRSCPRRRRSSAGPSATRTADPQNYIDLALALRSAPTTRQRRRTTDHRRASPSTSSSPSYGVLPPDPRAIIPSEARPVITW